MTAGAALVANGEQGKHVEGSHFEGSMAGTLQFSVDGAMMHQGGSRGLDELRQSTGQAASSMQPPLLCATCTKYQQTSTYAAVHPRWELGPYCGDNDCMPSCL